MIRVRYIELAKSSYGQLFICKNIIYAKCRTQYAQGSANTGSFFNESIIKVALNGEVCIGIRYVIEVAADNHRVRAFLDLLSYLFGLTATIAISPDDL